MTSFRRQVSPDLAVVVDESACIVLEAGLGDNVRSVTVSNVDSVKAALDDARTYQRAVCDG